MNREANSRSKEVGDPFFVNKKFTDGQRQAITYAVSGKVH